MQLLGDLVRALPGRDPPFGCGQAEIRPTGVEIVGIAVDNAAKVAEFTKVIAISYPVLLRRRMAWI
jgi:hypothetical protein